MCSASGFDTKPLPTPGPRARFPTRGGPCFLRCEIELEGFRLARWLGIGDAMGGREGRKHKACTERVLRVQTDSSPCRWHRRERSSSGDDEHTAFGITVETSGRRQWGVGVDSGDETRTPRVCDSDAGDSRWAITTGSPPDPGVQWQQRRQRQRRRKGG